MIYTKQLLARFISGSVDIDTLRADLTVKVCEVEETHERILPELVVIGKVLDAKKHPDADKLTVCQLDCGRHGHFQICTWATNIRENIYVPVALPGCFLPAIQLQIDPRKMRWLDSNGMICSKEELWISEDMGLHWIWILQDGAGTSTWNRSFDWDFHDITDKNLWTALWTYAPRIENRILDIENKTITQRPDLFWHWWLAWEYNAIFSDAVRFSRLPQIAEQLHPAQLWTTLDHAQKTNRAITIESPFVWSYAIVELTDIVVKESSFRQRLQILDLGIGTKNNRIDFGTYFMYLTGQPIHCFDADCVQWTITVRQATNGEQFTDLFDGEHLLTEDDIVICDEKGILALAWIIGGKTSGITEKTTKVTIEIAQFDPVVVRKTAMRLGLRTDAQTRYEKHIYPHSTWWSILLCLDELNYLWAEELWPWQLQWIATWIHPDYQKPKRRSIEIAQEYINRLLGTTLSQEAMKTILERLWCSVNEACTTVSLPIWRWTDDLVIQADICEEIARIYWFDLIEQQAFTHTIQSIPFSKTVENIRTIEACMTWNLWYTQIETYPRIHNRWHGIFGASELTCVQMENSITPEQSLLRNTMIPSLLEVIEKNAPVYDSLLVYDIGAVWQKKLPHEATHLCLARYQEKTTDRKNDPFLLMKQDVMTVLSQFLDTNALNRWHTTLSRAHTSQQTELFFGDILLGYITTIHPRLLDMIGVDPKWYSVVAAEIDCTILQQLTPKTPAEPVTVQDQLIRREVNFVVPKSVPFGLITDAVQQLPQIKQCELIDLYHGSTLWENEKSMSISFCLHGDGSMTTEQINDIMKHVIAAGESAWGKLRG